MSGVVLSFPGGGVANISHIAEAEMVEAPIYEPVDVCRVQQTVMLKRLDDLRKLVELGRVSGLIFIGQDSVTGHYITDVCLNPTTSRSELFGYVGVLDVIKMEISETAAMAPSLTLSGAILDPYQAGEAK